MPNPYNPDDTEDPGYKGRCICGDIVDGLDSNKNGNHPDCDEDEDEDDEDEDDEE